MKTGAISDDLSSVLYGLMHSQCVIWSQVVSTSVEGGKFRVIMQYMGPHCIVLEDGWQALEWKIVL